MNKVLKEISMKITETDEGEGGLRVMGKDDSKMKQVTALNNEIQSSCEN